MDDGSFKVKFPDGLVERMAELDGVTKRCTCSVEQRIKRLEACSDADATSLENIDRTLKGVIRTLKRIRNDYIDNSSTR